MSESQKINSETCEKCEKHDGQKLPKTSRLRRRAWIAFEVSVLLSLFLLAFWGHLLRHKDHDWTTWGIAIFMSAIDAWLISLATLGFCNISLFKLLGMKRRRFNELF